jgi:hypothetical protein
MPKCVVKTCNVHSQIPICVSENQTFCVPNQILLSYTLLSLNTSKYQTHVDVAHAVGICWLIIQDILLPLDNY